MLRDRNITVFQEKVKIAIDRKQEIIPLAEEQMLIETTRKQNTRLKYDTQREKEMRGLRGGRRSPVSVRNVMHLIRKLYIIIIVNTIESEYYY